MRRTRGQVLVMACLTFLLLAISMMASFSISHAVHERVRLQIAADAHAFTVATLEARGFNTIGYMNRAIAGGIVAELGLHAWYAIAKRDVSMYNAGFIAFLQVAAMEFAQCPKFQIQHCIHGIKALKIAFKYNKEKRSKQSDLQSKNQDWKEAVKGFSDMIKEVYKDEKELLDKVKSEIGDMSPTLMSIGNKTAPKATSKGMKKYNVSGLACAVEGSSFDDECKPASWKKAGSVSSASNRTKVMEEAANAARPKFEVGRQAHRGLSGTGYKTVPVIPAMGGTEMPDIPIPVMNPDKMMDIQGNKGTYMELGFGAQNVEVKNNRISSSVPRHIVMVQWEDGMGMWYTDGASIQGDYEGVPCNGGGGCFINYRMGPATTGTDDDSDYGQPATYGAYTQDLRTLGKGGKGAWEIEGKGEVKMPGGTGTWKYVPNNDGFAVAKGKTYFHQLGAWDVPPNLFDPMWRAKLQPFIRKEFEEILRTAGDQQGANLAGESGTSVEGVTQ